MHHIEALVCGLLCCSLSSPVWVHIPVCTSVEKIQPSKLTAFSFCAAQWLDVLQQLLQILEVPSTIVTGESHATICYCPFEDRPLSNNVAQCH